MNDAIEQSNHQEGYKEVQLGPRPVKIPSEWEVRNLDELTKNSGNYGANASAVDYDPEKPRYVRITDIGDDGFLKDDDRKSISRDDAEGYYLSAGDLLFARTGATVAKSYLCREDEIDAAYAGYLIRFELADSKVDAEFLARYVQSKLYDDWVDRITRHGAQQNINASEYRSLDVIYPPLPEQRRIADILSTVDEQIQQTDEMIEETKMLKEGLMQDLYRFGVENESFSTHRVGPREIEIPTHWELRTVDELKSINTTKKAIRGGPPGGRIKKSDRSEEGAKLYVQENVIHNDFERRGDYLSAEKFEELQSAEVDPGDVLITRSGTIGKSEVFPNDAQRGILGSSLIRVKVNEDIIRPQYLSQFLADSHVAQSQIKAMSHGGTRTGLNNKIVKSIQVPVPPIEEQDRISEILKTVEEKIQQEKQHRDDLKDLKRGLMQDLLTGKVRVNTH